LVLTFVIRHPRSPKSLGISTDQRKLGLFVQSLSFAAMTEREMKGFCDALTKQLEASEADRARRLENINTHTKQLEESEADRAGLLENINTLTKQLEVSEADRAQRLENINTLTKQLEASEAARALGLE